MMKLLHSIKNILEGKELIDNIIKFRILAIAAGLIHLVFCICMFEMDVHIMFYYNICIVIGYFFMGIVLAEKERFDLISILTIIEIEVHSTLATFLLGAEYRFMLYTVAMVPAAFYLTSTFAKGARHIRLSVFFSAIVILCYFLVDFFEPRIMPMYDTSAYLGIINGISVGNMFIAFFLQLVFALLFALENGYMYRLLEKENVKLGEEASYDPLTKLWNRRSLTRAIAEETERMGREDVFSVVMMDIDNFKSVNDTYGHDIGDVVLVGLSDIIIDEVREGDYSCRWGGEEFLIFAHGTRNDVSHVAERIRNRLKDVQFDSGRGSNFSVTITAGVAEYRYGAQLRNVIDSADRRLYYGKTNGKNQVVSA